MRRLVGILAALALAIGMVAAASPPAGAAKRSVWDRVARCESGGNWKISTGNGYYGGLQFSGSTWRAYGGKRYAGQAHRASRSEQIAIARRVLAGQGAGAWPTCGRKAGLTRSNGKASRKATPSSNPGANSRTFDSPKKSKNSAKKKASNSDDAKEKAKKPTSKSKKSVRVKRGDTLGKIAKRHHVRGGWKALWKMNKRRIRSPHSLKIGQMLRIR